MSSRTRPAPSFTDTGFSQPVASRNSSTLITRSSAPSTSGWRDGERRSIPAGMPRSRAISSVTLAAISWPPSPGFAPCEMYISTPSAWRIAFTLQPSRPPRHCTTTRLAASRTSGISPPSPELSQMSESVEALASAILVDFESAP